MADSADQTIGANIKRLRGAAGLKQADLVERMRANGRGDWHTTTLSRTESGERPLRLAEAEDIAEILDVEVADLLARNVSLEVLRDLERASVDLHLHGLGIGSAVREYLSKQDEVRALMDILPPLPDDATPVEIERRDKAVAHAEHELSVPYQWHADDALVPDDESRPYDPELDGEGWHRGIDQ